MTVLFASPIQYSERKEKKFIGQYLSFSDQVYPSPIPPELQVFDYARRSASHDYLGGEGFLLYLIRVIHVAYKYTMPYRSYRLCHTD